MKAGGHFKAVLKSAERTSSKIGVQTMSAAQHFKPGVLQEIALEELRTRLGRQILTLEGFPWGVSKMPSVEGVLHSYVQSFEQLRNLDHRDKARMEEKFEAILQSHGETQVNMTRGLFEWKLDLQQRYNVVDLSHFIPSIDEGLSEFYWNRNAMRLLISNFLAVVRHGESIVQRLNPFDVCQAAYEDAALLCSNKYGEAPDLVFGEERSDSVEFDYVEANLYYTLHELLKNALEASVLKNGDPVKVVIAKERRRNPVIKIHDRGKGMRLEDMGNMWSFFFSRSSNSIHRINSLEEFDANVGSSMLSGYGFGLPTAKLHTEFLKGTIDINSIRNVGTDVYVYL